MGYVGLPLAVEFGRAGFAVTGIDVDRRKCDGINGGRSDISDVPDSVVAANTFRAINIGLVNELALMSDRTGVSIWEVIEAASTKPFGFMPFYPGPGLGGHCIPIDP